MDFDHIIRHAQVFPGDAPPRSVDVGIRDRRIAAVHPSLRGATAREVTDAWGLMLCPGFIDMHAHSALEPFRNPGLDPKIAQGFTTEVINPDGLAPAPVEPDRRAERRAYLSGLEGPGPDTWTWTTVADYLDCLAATRPATTLVPSVGHNAVRESVMGGVNRQPTVDELRAMCRAVREAIQAGARTLSFGLMYLPGVFADTQELIALAREASRAGVPLVAHVRNEGAGVLGAVGEMIEVAQRSGAPLHVSHLKVVGHPHLVSPLLDLFDRASAGMDLSFDQYPYAAGSTLLSAVLPAWAQEGGPSHTLLRLHDPVLRQRIALDIQQGLPGWENLLRTCGPENICIAHAAARCADTIGKSLAQIAEEQQCDPLTAALNLLLETRLDAVMVDHYTTESVVRTIFRHPLALVGSDGIFGRHPHPRLYGTAPRALGRYALRENLISVEEAVARLTARAADRLGLRDRGRIAEGLRADLVLLDPTRYIDTATYDAPTSLPDGVVRVIVAGETVWLNGAPTGARPGGVCREQLGAAGARRNG